MSLLCALAKPCHFLCIVLCNSPTFAIGRGNEELRISVTLFGGFHSPGEGLSIVLRHAVAKVIQPAKLELRIGVALLRTFAIPDQGLSIVCPNAVAAEVIHIAKLDLRRSISRLCFGEQS